MADFNGDDLGVTLIDGTQDSIPGRDFAPVAAASDADDPTIGFGPAGGSIAEDATIEVTVDDPTSGIGFVDILAATSLSDPWEGVWTGHPLSGTDLPGYSTAWVDNGDGSFTGTITRTAGRWPGEALLVYVVAHDTSGNEYSDAAQYTVPANPGPSYVFTPDDGDETLSASSQRVEVTDPHGIPHVRIAVEYADRTELVFDGDPTGDLEEPGFSVAITAIANGFRFDISRDGGWPSDYYVIRAIAGDELGAGANVPFSAEITVTDPPPPLDEIAPEVGNVSPTPGTPIEATTPISFDVTDDSGAFRRVLVAVIMGGSGVPELAYDGDAFLGPYVASSSRVVIPDGFRFTLQRSGGWPSSPTVRVFPIDLGGNEA